MECSRCKEKDRVLSALWRWIGSMPPDVDCLDAMEDIMKVVDDLDETGQETTDE